MNGHSGWSARPIGILNDNMYYLSVFSGEVFDDSGELRRNGNRFMSDDDVERVETFFFEEVSRRDSDGENIGGEGNRMDLAMMDIQTTFTDAGVTFGAIASACFSLRSCAFDHVFDNLNCLGCIKEFQILRRDSKLRQVDPISALSCVF